MHVHSIMSCRVKRNCDILKVLAKCKPPMRIAIIKAADDDLLKDITECLLNICKGTIKISPRIHKKLTPYADHTEVVADKSKPITQRRRRVILQKGDGFLPFLLAPVLEHLASFLINRMEHVKRLVLVPEHITDIPKKALVPPLTAQVNN